MRDKLSERAIAKRTGLSRNTVHKWLQTPEEVQVPKYVRAKGYSKLGDFTDELELALKADAMRPKKDRRTARWSMSTIPPAKVIVVNQGTSATDFVLRSCPPCAMNQFRKPQSGGSHNQQISTLIHSCQFKKQLPALGQYSIGANSGSAKKSRMGQLPPAHLITVSSAGRH